MNLNFGRKSGYDDDESNLTFENEFNSYGHCFQGFLAILLFPECTRHVSPLPRRYRSCARLSLPPALPQICVELLGASCGIYPAYNVLKVQIPRSQLVHSFLSFQVLISLRTPPPRLDRSGS